MHGSWESFTGFNAPLYKRSDETGEQATLNVDWAVQYWLSKGAPRDKLILGLGTYGRSFRLTSSANNQPGAGANGAASAGIVKILQNKLNLKIQRFFDLRLQVKLDF